MHTLVCTHIQNLTDFFALDHFYYFAGSALLENPIERCRRMLHQFSPRLTSPAVVPADNELGSFAEAFIRIRRFKIGFWKDLFSYSA